MGPGSFFTEMSMFICGHIDAEWRVRMTNEHARDQDKNLCGMTHRLKPQID